MLLGWAACISAFAGQRGSTLLVRAGHGTLNSCRNTLSSFGSVESADPMSGLFLLRLKPGLDPQAVKRRLLESGRALVAIDSDSSAVDRRFFDSVNEHTIYLEQVVAHQHRDRRSRQKEDEVEPPSLDHWEAYRHFMRDHVSVGGYLDEGPFVDGANHRDAMPAGFPVYNSRNGPVASPTWSYVGPNNLAVPYVQYYGVRPLSGRVNCIAVNPANDQVIYAGAAEGGVWKSVNGGISWAPLSDKWPFLCVSSIALDPGNPQIVYVGTGDYQGGGIYGTGIMRSADGGSTWANYGAISFNGMAISKIIVDPTNPSIVLACAGNGANPNDVGGIYRSTNSGQSWARTNAPSCFWASMDVSLPDSKGNRTFWAAGHANYGGIPSGEPVYKSVDHGLTWIVVATRVNSAELHNSASIACSKVSPSTVYLLDPSPPINAVGTAGSHIWKSTNSGATWTDISTGFPRTDPAQPGLDPYYNWSQDDYDYFVATSRIGIGSAAKDAVYVGLITIAASPDAGSTWIDLGKTYSVNPSTFQALALTHNDQHCFATDPLRANTALLGNDGGLYRLVYNPVTKSAAFTSLNAGLGITQFYKICAHPSQASVLMGGAQDNAGPASTGNLADWINPGAGDGASVVYDSKYPNIAYFSSQGLSINYTTNGWNTYGSLPGGTPWQNREPVNFIPPLALSNPGGSVQSVLFAGTDFLWKWDPRHLWTADLGGTRLTTATLRSIAPCPNDSGKLYTGADDGQVWMTTNLGGSWRQVDAGFSRGAPVVSMSVSPSNSADVLAAITQTGQPSNLWRCANTSASLPKWVAVCGSGATALPAVPVNVVVRDPSSPGTIWYVGTDLGVFVTQNAGVSWSNMTAPFGLPNTIVNDLSVNAGTGYLTAGTYGRGIWRIRIR